MKQTLKIIIGSTIWFFIGLYILAIIVLQNPSFQQYVGSEVEALLSEKLGTKVKIDKVNFGILNRIIIDGAVIYDQKDKEMVNARRLSVKISIPDLLDGRISISSAQIFATHVNLYQDKAGANHNFQFVLDSLASKDTTSSTPLNLRINSLIMRHSSLSYHKHHVDSTPGVLNPAHINISDISAHIILKALKADTANLNVKRLAFKEQSGLDIQKLSMALTAGSDGCMLNDLTVQMPQSHFGLDTLKATYKYRNKKIDWKTFEFSGSSSKSVLYANDLSFIVPSLSNRTDSIEFFTDFIGSASYIRVNRFNASIPSGILTILASNSQRNLGDIGEILIDGKCQIDTIGNGFLNIGLNSNIGNLDIAANIGNKYNLSGRISTDSIQIVKLLKSCPLSIIKLNSQFTAKLDSSFSPELADCQLDIPVVEYKSYRYHDIALNGNYKPTSISGKIVSDDPNASFSIDALLAKTANRYQADIKGMVSNFATLATNTSDKWGDASFSGEIDVQLQGSRLEDINGIVRISDLHMESPKSSYHLNSLVLDALQSEKEQTITLASDFGHLRVNGKFNYSTLHHSVLNLLRDKLPTMPGLPTETVKTNNRLQLYCALDRTDWLETLLGIPFQLNKRTTLMAKIDDKSNQLYANCVIPVFFYKNKEYRDAVVAITTPDDTLVCDVSISQIMKDDIPFMLNLRNKASNNKLLTSIQFDNNADKRLIGELSAATLFINEQGNPTAHINIMPSTLNINDDEWKIRPSEIVYKDKNIAVNNFYLHHGSESIGINGKATDSASDQLRVSLRNIDVNYVLNLVNFRSVRFGGLATGMAYIHSPFSDMLARAKLMVNKFTFQDGRMGVLDANVNWDNANKQININAVADDGPDALTYINGYVSPTSPGYIDLKIRAAGTHLNFLESFTNSFTKDVNGHIYGLANLIGPLNKINLVGDLVVDGSAHIKPLNTRYYLKHDTLKLNPDEIYIRPSLITDIYDNKATFSGYIRHKNLTRLSYDLNVKTDNLLVYDFKEFGDEVFCGTVFGAGNVDIHGASKILQMDVDMTTMPNSTFTYNVSTPDAIIDQKFIRWNVPSEQLSNDKNTKLRQSAYQMSGDTEIRFKINCTPDASVRFLMDSRTNDCIDLHGGGTFNALYHNKQGFNMYGTYLVERGTYTMTIQDILKKNFTFKEGGSLKFSGNPSKAQLNLQAVHTVNSVSLADLNVGNSYSDNTTRVNCLLNITGEPFALQLDYGLELPTASSDQERNIRSVIQGEDGMKQQVIYLLGFGRFMPQSNSSDTYQDPNKLSQTTQAMQGLLSGTISTQINNLLGSAINNNNWNFGANISTGDEGWHNAEYEGLLNGRLLNNRLLINGQFGYRDNAKTANSSFIGDFDISYLLVPSGNLALKVYNKTNDRYFTKSSLNTQGVGFLIKKDFTSFSELFSKKKRRK